MKYQDLITSIISSAKDRGTFTVPDLVRFARSENISGIAAAQDEKKVWYLVFLNGEAEGAIYADDNGELFGDKAVLRITGREEFTLYDGDAGQAGAVVMVCRIFEKTHLTAYRSMVPEIGRRSSGVGHLTLVIRTGGVPTNGIRVSLRKDGKIVGSDITTQDGRAGFRLLYDDYTCIVQDKNQMIRTFPVTFSQENQQTILDV